MLHIVPGIVITAVYILLSSVVVSPAIPKALLFYAAALVLIPTCSGDGLCNILDIDLRRVLADYLVYGIVRQ